MRPDYRRKVNATCMFHPHASPSNPIACGIPRKEVMAAKVNRLPIPDELKFKMALHRAILRGNGFYDVLVRSSGEINELAKRFAKARIDVGVVEKGNRLPVVNLIRLPEEHIEALMQEALPADRQRFINYLSKRPLGLGCIAAGPGFGKTTALAVGTLGMAATLGKIYGTAPTHVATDNFAERLDRISQSVTRYRNKDKLHGDRTRARRALVIRGYKIDEEYEAFVNALRDPCLGDDAAPNRQWSIESRWKLHLSPSFWLLVALGSPAVRKLHEDDPQVVFEVQRVIDSIPEYRCLRDVATKVISWQEYEGNMIQKVRVGLLLSRLVNEADILCTTPSLSCKGLFFTWKVEKAKGIAVDEAGNISRPDLYSVWGNTLLPCLLSGDDKQFPPMVMTLNNEDGEGNALNRLSQDGQMSALEFFKASGWPIYRLRTQLRMANGLFDTCHREVYSDVPFTYGLESNLFNHLIGLQLEKYLIDRFAMLSAARPGTLAEVFVHCQDTQCFVNEVTMSKRNPDQVDCALEFLSDLVTKTRINAANINIITPYSANAELVNQFRTRPGYEALAAMPPAATVDSFQGREADIMVVIMGTTEEVGPGFTTDEHRLNVMLSRQRSGLLVFGDINVVGRTSDRPRGPVRPGGGKERKVVVSNGAKHVVKEGMLHSVLRGWRQRGRVIVLPPRA